MPYLTEFLTVAVVHFLAVASPGPDFVMLSRNSLVHGRKTGVYSAIGLGLGITVHVAYSLVGIGFLIAKSTLLFSLMKFVGAGYLFYIGYKSLTAKSSHLHLTEQKESKEMSPVAAIRMGFLTNVTNPKATLFFLALFTQVINPETPMWIQLLYGIEMSFVTFAWFALLAVLLSLHIIKNKFARIQHATERVMGVILIALGAKLVFSSAK